MIVNVSLFFRVSLKNWKVQETVLIHDVDHPTISGPLRDLRNNSKLWAVLKKKRLYFFKDLRNPADHIINMSEYDIYVENMVNFNFRLRKPGFPSLLLGAEKEEEYRKWVQALQNCKYEEVDDLLQKAKQKPSNDQVESIQDGEAEEEPEYEAPTDILDKMARRVSCFLNIPARFMPAFRTLDVTVTV